MTCAHCCDARRLFSDRRAKKELRKYRRKGPDPSTRLLVDAIRDRDVSGGSLLDIGGGVGAIQHELVSAGASEATSVEASPGYAEANEEETSRRGYADRASHHLGDFVELAAELPEVDIVTLDRVVCCYPDMPRLVAASTAKARRFYGLVFPRSRWPVRLVIALLNLMESLKRSAFRAYIHPPPEIDAAVRSAGLDPVYEGRTFMWQVALYARP